MRVLLVEDSPRLQTYIARGLRQAGYTVDVSGDGEEGLWYALEHEYDVFILDVMLPNVDGLEVLRRLRARSDATHVLLLTAKDTVEDRVRGLDQGADDYVVKPFALEELLARVNALVRRKYNAKSGEIVVGNLTVDTLQRRAFRAGHPIELRPREFAVLELLAYRRGEVLSRTEIERHIYDDIAEPASNVVNAAISLLRRAIDLPGQPSLIETRRGEGYTLKEPDSSDQFAHN